jgi:predicted transposase YbfD/YdcC
MRCFAVLESERTIGDKTTSEQRLYISSLAPHAQRIAEAVRSHWSMGVSFNGDQMRVRTKAAAHNLAMPKHITLNLIRLDPAKRKDGIKARQLIAATSDLYRAHLLGLG